MRSAEHSLGRGVVLKFGAHRAETRRMSHPNTRNDSRLPRGENPDNHRPSRLHTVYLLAGIVAAVMTSWFYLGQLGNDESGGSGVAPAVSRVEDSELVEFTSVVNAASSIRISGGCATLMSAHGQHRVCTDQAQLPAATMADRAYGALADCGTELVVYEHADFGGRQEVVTFC